MAPFTLRLLRSASRYVLCGVHRNNLPISKRYLLSSAYSCTDTWEKSLNAIAFGDLPLSDFAVKIYEQLEKSGNVSAVDINVFAHQLQQLEGDEDEAELVEDILKRYNNCQDSFPPLPSISHAVVRGYISTGLANRLPPLISDPSTFGLFPNHYTLNLLIDHFIKNQDFTNAVTLAYYSTLQEDFSDPINVLLCLYACTQYLANLTDIDSLAPENEVSDGEEEWIKVKFIKNHYYDDHFDIKDQRYLLGKTMMMISESQCIQIPQDISDSLKIIGAGLYNKFPQGLSILKSGSTISLQALDYFHNTLQRVESRDANESEIDISLRGIEDEIHKLLPSHEEKENFITEFGEIKEKLVSHEKIVKDFSLDKRVAEFITSSITEYEESSIDNQCQLFESWRKDWERELANQLRELKKHGRMEEMKRQIKELQEEEELQEYFQKEEKVRLNFIESDAEQSDPSLTVNKI